MGADGGPIWQIGGWGATLPCQNFTYTPYISYILIMVVIPTDLLKGKQNEQISTVLYQCYAPC
jgi:hypothetical protein